MLNSCWLKNVIFSSYSVQMGCICIHRSIELSGLVYVGDFFRNQKYSGHLWKGLSLCYLTSLLEILNSFSSWANTVLHCFKLQPWCFKKGWSKFNKCQCDLFSENNYLMTYHYKVIFIVLLRLLCFKFITIHWLNYILNRRNFDIALLGVKIFPVFKSKSKV